MFNFFNWARAGISIFGWDRWGQNQQNCTDLGTEFHGGVAYFRRKKWIPIELEIVNRVINANLRDLTCLRFPKNWHFRIVFMHRVLFSRALKKSLKNLHIFFWAFSFRNCSILFMEYLFRLLRSRLKNSDWPFRWGYAEALNEMENLNESSSIKKIDCLWLGRNKYSSNLRSWQRNVRDGCLNNGTQHGSNYIALRGRVKVLKKKKKYRKTKNERTGVPLQTNSSVQKFVIKQSFAGWYMFNVTK